MVRQRLHRIFSIFIMGVFICLAATSSLHAASRAETLFQEAMVKESGERDPEAALELYRQVVELAGRDHRLVAEARLHMGSCLERLGKPKEAEELYLEIIKDSTASLVEAVQAAQANLEKLQTQEKKAREEAAKFKPMVLVHEFHDTGFSALGGPALLHSGTKTGVDLSIAGRYRLSPLQRPLALFAEVGGLFPVSGSTIADSVQSSADTASLKLRYQMHLALVAELPHGIQKRTIPEVGVGAALTSSKISYTNSNSAGDSSETNWSPYLVGGVRFFADRRVSLLVDVSYTANPYSKNISISAPAHNQTFDFPNGMWNIGAQVQVKIGWTKAMMRPKE